MMCVECKKNFEEYLYTIHIVFNDGEVEYTNEIESNLTEKDMEKYTEELKEIYDNVSEVHFVKICPHCLSTIYDDIEEDLDFCKCDMCNKEFLEDDIYYNEYENKELCMECYIKFLNGGVCNE